MHRLSLVWATMAASAVTAGAGDFPLEFKTIPAKDVMAFPGGYGLGSPLGPNRPVKITKEPKAVCRRPLYSECRLAGGSVIVVRLDESKGDGKGYDQLIADLNQNGDLTDDPVAPQVVEPGERKAALPTAQVLFGPLEAPASKAIAGGRPVCFAQVYLYNRQIFGSQASRSVATPRGYLRLKAGWYLETTVELDGLKQEVGVYDGDGNMRLGDVAKPQALRGVDEEPSWYFRPGDSWLVDANGSGGFERDALQSESCPFGPILYLGAKPYKAALASDLKSLKVEPWTEPLAEVSLQPHGEQVSSVTLAWERPGDQWQLIRAGVSGGKINVPAGNYRLYGCDLLGKTAPANQVMASASQRAPQKPFGFVAEKSNTLRCGAPLEIAVTASKTSSSSGLFGLFSSDADDSSSGSSRTVRINATVRGAGGEMYSNYRKGQNLGDRPPQPEFTVVDDFGNQVADGKLEYG